MHKIYIKGYLNSYIDKNKRIQSFISVTKISEDENSIVTDNNLHIRYDEDGVMVWNGKKCESGIATEEEINKMKKMLGGMYNERK